jgi:hypothetical protein
MAYTSASARSLLLCLGVCFAAVSLSAPTQAQVLGIELKGAKAIKRHKKHVIEINGKAMIVGEPLAGISWDSATRTANYMNPGANVLYVADPKNPEKVPYRFRRGQRVSSGKKGKVTIDGTDIAFIHAHLPEQSLMGLADEYALRESALEDLKAERKSCAKGSVEWFAAQERIVVHLERLENWLRRTAFPGAADDIAKDIRKERKVKLVDGVDARALRAKDSIEKVPIPALLESCAQEHGGGKWHFRVHQSEHVRITHCIELVSDEVAVGLLGLAERLIEGFRVDLVDPYRSDTYPDHIPDGWFQEFYLGPDELPMFEKMWESYYLQSWGPRKAERIQMSGTGTNIGSPTRRVNYWRITGGSDLDGIIAHGLGHTLADLHYSGGLYGMAQDWLEEAVGYYLSIEYLGRNNVTCHGHFDPEKDRYGKSKKDKEDKKKGDKPLRMGLRDFFVEHALADGPRYDKLIPKIRFEFNEADLCKAWSFYEFIVKSEGEKGQRLLRANCRQARNKGTMVNNLRDDGAELYELKDEDFYKWIEEKWRAWATRG